MGSLCAFHCTKCRYKAEVSGGDDCGMEAMTTTIVCEDCRKLCDIEIGTVQIMLAQSDQPEPPVVLHCPKNPSHRVRPWKAGDPCPRCGAPMENRGLRVLWD